MIYYTCVIIDKVEKTGLVYSSLPTGCGAGISGPDETKVMYEEITGSRNKYVCIYSNFSYTCSIAFKDSS